WGLSTRSIGGLIMAHGDDNGLRLPPRLAPIQVIMLPIKVEDEILSVCETIAKKLGLSGIRVKVDSSDNETLGSKINKWELKGVPLRMEIGLKEIEAQTITVVRRDTGEKLNFSVNESVERISVERINDILVQIQKNLYEEAKKFLSVNTRNVENYDEFKKTLSEDHGFLSTFWCEDEQCEKKIKEETKATTRCLPLPIKEENGACVYCGKPAKHRWLFGQAY
ncbi:MAG: His/Gly/Thr/Pro-type tRNA ligase C-terminal domain-containing protein, partial [Candidatus Taylorbacteria bacterium]|nr:His/Gly/Thr/Pro-type tRNA ligase C-terminal domain-containing protein [Candidatus Taylorbacteria bacterium]